MAETASETGPEAMRRHRAARDLSQNDLARIVDVTPGAISQYERGLYVPRRRIAEQIDDALDAVGDVLRGFGYLPGTDHGEIDRGQIVDDLTERVATLEDDVRTLKANMAELIVVHNELAHVTGGRTVRDTFNVAATGGATDAKLPPATAPDDLAEDGPHID